jgi:hypothetical protein
MENINIQAMEPIFRQNDISFAGIFGSRAKGMQEKSSDLDILVDFKKPKSLIDLIRVQNILSDILNLDVDLVTEDSVSPLIKDNILNDLVVIYGKR